MPTRENKYESLIIHLNKNHIYPVVDKTLPENKKIITTGLHVNCSPILKDEKIDYLKKVLEGMNCLVSWVGNGADYILIKLKQ